jgi:predicted negative regulator of RcsB-dependent stress response
MFGEFLLYRIDAWTARREARAQERHAARQEARGDAFYAVGNLFAAREAWAEAQGARDAARDYVEAAARAERAAACLARKR